VNVSGIERLEEDDLISLFSSLIRKRNVKLAPS